MISMKRDDDPQKNRPVKKARVLCYSGYKREETPRAILVDDKEIELKKIISRKRIHDAATGRLCEVFMCETGQGTVKIELDENGEWTVVFL